MAQLSTKLKLYVKDNGKDIEKKSKTKSSIYINNDSLLNLIDKFNGKTTIIFLGAGSVTKWAKDFYSLLKRAYEYDCWTGKENCFTKKRG